MMRIFAALALVIGLLAAAIASDPPLPRPDLVWIEPSDFITLDPQRMSHLPDFRIAYALFEGLVRWDTTSADLHVVPAVAESWEISPDGMTYTFHLDPAARWSNGDPVTAADFVYAWRRALLPETGADYINLFQLVKGGEGFARLRAERLKEYKSGAVRTEASVRALRAEIDLMFASTGGLETPDPMTLIVHLERPVPYFLDLLAFGPFLPVHAASVDRFVDLDPETGTEHQRSGWTKPPNLVGNGPYVLERWRFKRDMRLARNPYFRDPALAVSDSIGVAFIEDPNTALLAFQSGAADWHGDLEVGYIGDLLAQVRAGERKDVRALDAFGTYFWSFNCSPKLSDGRDNPFRDARVRRAFALAVDKEMMVQRVRRGAERPAKTFIPPGSIPGYESPVGLSFDLALAREEFLSAGWEDRDGDGVPEDARGQKFPTVELLCTPAGPHRDVAQVLAGIWESAFGVRSKVVVRETKVHGASVKKQDFMLARGAWFGDYLDPTTFLDIHRTGDGNNDRAFSDQRYDALLERAERSTDARERLATLAEAERLMVEEGMPILPMWHYAQYYLCRPADAFGGLRGLSTHPRLIQYPSRLSVNREGGPR